MLRLRIFKLVLVLVALASVFGAALVFLDVLTIDTNSDSTFKAELISWRPETPKFRFWFHIPLCINSTVSNCLLLTIVTLCIELSVIL